MGSFTGALLIGKVSGSWDRSTFPWFPCLLHLSSHFGKFSGLKTNPHIFLRIWAQEESHCLPHGDAVGALQGKYNSHISLSESESPNNWMNISRRGFQTWRLPWRRLNTILLQFFPFSTRFSFAPWQVSISEDEKQTNLIISRWTCPASTCW